MSMIRIRRQGSRSWLDFEGCRALGAKLRERLQQRCKGQEGLFLTLTYSRDCYGNPRDLYRAASEEKHVAMFMRRLGRATSKSFAGRWICKLEFQRGGWVHFHIVLLGVRYLKHTIIANAWGHGFVHVRKLSADACGYMTKYVAKDGTLPDFLLLEPLRSVKIIRVSRGFWGDEAAAEAVRGDDALRERLPLSAYQTIGCSLTRNEARTVSDAAGRFKVHEVPFHLMLRRVLAAGWRVVGRVGRWLELDHAEGGAAAQRAAGADTAERLHLIHCRNRDVESDRPCWLIAAMSEILAWRAAA